MTTIWTAAGPMHHGHGRSPLIGHVHRTNMVTVGMLSRAPKHAELMWDPVGSVRRMEALPAEVPIGTCIRDREGRWWRRVTRRTSGHTWKKLKDIHVPKRIQVEMLLAGLS